jgi:hypothetical protein
VTDESIPPGRPASGDSPGPTGPAAPAGREGAGAQSSAGGVQYKGAPLDPARGPGLGCFYLQLVVLAIVVVVTPLSVVWGWPAAVSAALLLIVIVLLFFAGQTIIFLGRLVAADRRAEGRRRPLASPTRTVGELEDERAAREQAAQEPAAPAFIDEPGADPAGEDGEEIGHPSGGGPVRQ